MRAVLNSGLCVAPDSVERQAPGQQLRAEHSRRVLVTGAAGYIGSVLCGWLLAAGYRLTAVDNLMYGQSSLLHLCAHAQFEFVRGDVRDGRLMAELIKDQDVIVPLAAIVGAPACERDPETARSVNVDSVRMLNRLRRPGQLVVFPTTNSGYGTRSGNLNCDEETPLKPISVYGQTKVEAERELLASPNTITLRLATVFGISPRMRIDLLVNYFVHAAVTAGYIVIFEKDFKRNFLHIGDAADCFVFCIENAQRMAGRPFNVGLDSASLSKEELAFKVKQFLPDFYIHFAQIGSDPDQRNYIVSSERLREAGFQAHRSLEVGIQELVKGYRIVGSSDSLSNI